MNKIIKVTALLITSLYSTTTFAHTGHGNNNIHNHNGSDHFLIIFIIGLLIGFASYYIYKKNSPQ